MSGTGRTLIRAENLYKIFIVDRWQTYAPAAMPRRRIGHTWHILPFCGRSIVDDEQPVGYH